jgi:hypothetical protein
MGDPSKKETRLQNVNLAMFTRHGVSSEGSVEGTNRGRNSKCEALRAALRDVVGEIETEARATISAAAP